MTAPAPVAPVTNAPASAPMQDGPFGVNDAVDQIARDTIAQTLAEQANPAPADGTTEQPRGPDGKFVARPHEGTDAIANANAPVDGTDATANPDGSAPAEPPIELPDGFVAVAPVQGRDLVTSFKVLDHEGELDVPDLMIEFNANGKTRREPLDQVVRFAERGVYNEEREQAVLQSRREVTHVQGENQFLKRQLEELQIDRERLLASDEAYLEARAKYEADNTPDARLQRMQAERAAEQTAAIWQQATEQSNQYFVNTVAPAVEQIAGALSTVTADEIGARLVLLTNPLRMPTPDGGSIIPPKHHQDVARLILQDIVPWAQTLHDERSASTKAQRDAAEQEKKAAAEREAKARTDAQKARNLVGRQTRPRGAAPAGPGTRDTEPTKPIKTVDDAEAAVLRDTLAAVV